MIEEVDPAIRVDRRSVQAVYPFGEEATAFNQDGERMKFTGHERELHSAAGAGDDLDYMHARYCSPLSGRFLSTDALNGRSTTLQSWNRYTYALNNPLALVDPDGNQPLRFLVKTAQGIYRYVNRSKAARVAARRAHAVKVEGSGASRAARQVAREANPNARIVRHEPHRAGDLPHYQPSTGGRGHVAYDPKTMVVAGGTAGTLFGGEVAAATGSETTGAVAGTAFDLVLPPELLGAPFLLASSIKDLNDLIDFIGSLQEPGAESMEEDEEDAPDLDSHGSVFGERLNCVRSSAGGGKELTSARRTGAEDDEGDALMQRAKP